METTSLVVRIVFKPRFPLKITLRRSIYGVLTLTNLSCMVVGPKIVNRIILQEKKVQVSRSLEVLGSRTGIPKGLKKMENSGGEQGLMILEFGGHGGIKIFMPTMVGSGYFLESPNG